MNVLVVCGAGASSTFVALRLNRAAKAAGIELSARAGTLDSVVERLDAVDLLLVGPHLADAYDELRRQAQARGVASALLPEDVFTDPTGERALELVRSGAEPPRADASPSA